MDAFYASVEEHDDPRLAGKPLIVGWDGGRGVVAAASYAVRRYGVHSAMPMRTGLTGGVGVARNRLVAKIASDLIKPDGLTHVTPERVREVLDPLSVRRLPGLGRKTGARVEAAGIKTLGELRSAPDALLWPLFGRYSAWVRERASGIDDRPVLADVEEKSLSAEDTFEHDIGEPRALQ